LKLFLQIVEDVWSHPGLDLIMAYQFVLKSEGFSRISYMI
jgi:hypothetical protein